MTKPLATLPGLITTPGHDHAAPAVRHPMNVYGDVLPGIGLGIDMVEDGAPVLDMMISAVTCSDRSSEFHCFKSHGIWMSCLTS